MIELFDKLVAAGLSLTPLEGILEIVGTYLTEIDFPVDEIRLTGSTLHPSINAMGMIWADGKISGEDLFLHSEGESEQWKASPLKRILSEGLMRYRRRLDGSESIDDYQVLKEFQDRGMTDYFVTLVPFGEMKYGTNASGIMIRWLSKRPGGFSDADLEVLVQLSNRMGSAALPAQQRQIARNLMTAYVGEHTAERILDGQVQPGDTQSLQAVILVADLAGFTVTSDKMPGAELIRFLNRHFEAMIPAVEAHEGEILAFLGDGFLAAFATEEDEALACRNALEAALEITEKVSGLSHDLASPLRVDVAIHKGEVQYGNIGAAGRQAFTVIGPAVNVTSRMEQLCNALGASILVSEAVAATINEPRLVSVGRHPLRGVESEIEIFRLRTS